MCRVRGKYGLVTSQIAFRESYILAELPTDGSDLLVQRGRVHHYLLLVGSYLEDSLYISAHAVFRLNEPRVPSLQNYLRKTQLVNTTTSYQHSVTLVQHEVLDVGEI